VWPVVWQHFPSFIAEFEGRERWLYLDELGFLTTAVGNLMEPYERATALAWYHESTGKPATKLEVLRACQLVKSRQDLAGIGGGKPEFEKLTDLRLRDDAIDDLVREHWLSDTNVLVQRFPNLVDMPADIQLCFSSMAWAMGPGFDFPVFVKHCVNGEFRKAADECRIRNARPKRNAANKQLCINAALVVEKGLPFDAFYPGDEPVIDVTDGGRDKPIFRGPFLDLPEDDDATA
jgi:hypothetical protein